MRVLYVIDSLVPGGSETSLAETAPHLVDAGVSLEVVYLHNHPGLQDRFEEHGIPLQCLAGGRGRVAWFSAARRLIQQRRPDLVHTTLFEADIIGRLAAASARIPVVSSLVTVGHGPAARPPDVRVLRSMGALAADAITARFVRRFHAVSYHVAEVMCQRLRIPRQRIDVIHRGRDPKVLGRCTEKRRTRARALLPAGPEEKVVLAAARHEHPKGLDILLRAFPRVAEKIPLSRLVVAGREGNQTPALYRLARSLGLERVEFLGPRRDLTDLLCAADAFILPSRWEGLPGVMLEAMALEAPIVASDLPAVREILSTDRTALLVPPQRPDLLADAIIETLVDRASAVMRVRSARARFLEGFTIQRCVDGMVSFYERAMRAS
jgi:glycosyltransferase involved in cell wall biosynthesis